MTHFLESISFKETKDADNFFVNCIVAELTVIIDANRNFLIRAMPDKKYYFRIHKCLIQFTLSEVTQKSQPCDTG